jgi:hypothetical protein
VTELTAVDSSGTTVPIERRRIGSDPARAAVAMTVTRTGLRATKPASCRLVCDCWEDDALENQWLRTPVTTPIAKIAIQKMPMIQRHIATALVSAGNAD